MKIVNEIKESLLNELNTLGIDEHFISSNSFIFYWTLEWKEVVVKVIKKHTNMNVCKAWEWEVKFLKDINQKTKSTSILIDSWITESNYHYIILEKYDWNLKTILQEEVYHYNYEKKVIFLYDLLITIGSVVKVLKEIWKIHQDIKPENILYKKNGDKYDFYLADFWLLTTYKERQQTTMMWNKFYRAPEQFDHSYVRCWWWLSHKADIYPLWIIATEILTNWTFKKPSFLFSKDEYIEEYGLKNFNINLKDLLVFSTKEFPEDRIDIDTFLYLLKKVRK